MATHSFPPGPYERDGATVYKLTGKPCGKQAPNGINIFTARVQHQTCVPEVAESIAILFQAATDLLAACEMVKSWCELNNRTYSPIYEPVCAAIAKAKGGA